MTYMDETIQSLSQFEGRVPWMYQDTVAKVTVGVGCMLPNPDAAAALPFRRYDGTSATGDEIRAEYARVKALPSGLKAKHYFISRALTLSDVAIDTMMLSALVKFESGLEKLFPSYDSFPDPGKIAVLHMAYNLGLAGLPEKFPRLTAAIRAEQWHTAALECNRPQLSAVRNAWTAAEFQKAALANTAV